MTRPAKKTHTESENRTQVCLSRRAPYHEAVSLLHSHSLLRRVRGGRGMERGGGEWRKGGKEGRREEMRDRLIDRQVDR